MLTAREVAHRLGHGEEWLRQHQTELRTANFPAMDPLLGRWDNRAIDLWLDERIGLRPTRPAHNSRGPSTESILIERAKRWRK